MLDGIVGPVIALLILVASAVVVRLLWSQLLVRRRRPGLLGRWLAEKTATPVFLLVLAAGSRMILGELTALPQFRRLSFSRYIDSGTYLLTVAAATWAAYVLLRALSEWYLTRMGPQNGGKIETELLPLIRRLAQVVLLFTAATIILDHYDVKLTALLGVAGVASLATALAAQDTLANMIAGFTIMLDRPFRVGDRVELPGGRVGDVFEIGLRSTRILSPDHTVHIIPNAELAKSAVINHSYPDHRINVRQRLALAYGNDLNKAKRIAVETCRLHPLVLADPPPGAFASELAENTVLLNFNFWIADHRQKGPVLDEILSGIYERFEREGIRAPAQRMEVSLRPAEAPAGAPAAPPRP